MSSAYWFANDYLITIFIFNYDITIGLLGYWVFGLLGYWVFGFLVYLKIIIFFGLLRTLLFTSSGIRDFAILAVLFLCYFQMSSAY